MKWASPNLKRTLWVALYLSPFLFLLAYCGIHRWPLGSALLYEGPQFRLKLARYYENYPWHFTGEVFDVLCASKNTTGNVRPGAPDRGWNNIAHGQVSGSTSEKELVEKMRSRFIVANDHTLVVVENGVRVSVDACGSFREWSPSSLPRELIEPAKKPPGCAPEGQNDCSYLDKLVGQREPTYENVLVSSNGTISFVVRSLAFKNKKVVRVHTQDYGNTWKAEIH